MQILNSNANRLELEHRPMQWIVGLGVVCAVLAIALLKALLEAQLGGVAISSLMLAALGWIWLTRIFLIVRLTADRDVGTLRITIVSRFGETFRERDLADLSGAEIETRYSETSSVAEPGLVLKFGNERHRMKLFKPDAAELLQAAEAINAWLEQTRSSQAVAGEAAQ